MTGTLSMAAPETTGAEYFDLGAAQVTVIEPIPLAPLVANVVPNGLTGVNRMEAPGIVLGAESEGGPFMKRRDRNLGGTKMLRGKGADLQVDAGDVLFAEDRFDLIKIDVEGMEMEVLAGLEPTVARCRPLIFIKVEDANAGAFRAWAAERGYTPVCDKRHYGGNMNFLMKPGAAS